MAANPSQIQGAIATVMQKASRDAAYRERAFQEPVAVLNEAGGLDLPLNTPIRFADTQEEILVPLPAFGSDLDEITDEEMLANVSGGATPLVVITATYVAAVYVAVELLPQWLNKK